MSIESHLTNFGGFTVQQWEPGLPLGDPNTTIHRIAEEYDDERSWVDKFHEFLDQPGVQDIQGFVVGLWDGEGSMDGDPQPMLEALVTAHSELRNLRVLFVNDIISEESEVSWIPNTDLSPLLAAYPNLMHLGIRGGNNLSLGQVDLPELRQLVIQAGGLSAEVVRQVMEAKLPKLEHLELYLGTDEYGATSTPADWAALLNGKPFPNLKYLGLKNSDQQDEIAQILANSPVLNGLHTLDLSMGVLTDEGAQALLSSEHITKLKKLDVHHHFCTLDMVARLEALPIKVDASDAQDEDDEWRFVALGE